MLAVERRQAILDALYREKRLYVAAMSQRFDVTEETIRKDLEKLEKQGFLSRVYGGAVINRHQQEEVPYMDRETINRDLKRIIASQAVALIEPGDRLMIDSTTTCHELLEMTNAISDLTLITNSARLAYQSAGLSHSIVTLGGELRKRSMSYCGSFTEDNARHFNADIFFFSCRGLDIDRGVTEATLPESCVKQAMMRQSERTVLLVDHTKFDSVTFVNLCPLERLDTVITDRAPSEKWMSVFQDNGVQLLYPT